MKPVKNSIRANQDELALREDEKSSPNNFERLERKFDIARELRGY